MVIQYYDKFGRKLWKPHLRRRKEAKYCIWCNRPYSLTVKSISWASKGSSESNSQTW